MPEVHNVLGVMAAFSARVRSGALTGDTGKRVRDVVNIGIDGRYLGPEMEYRAFRSFSDRAKTFRFVARRHSNRVPGSFIVDASMRAHTEPARIDDYRTEVLRRRTAPRPANPAPNSSRDAGSGTLALATTSTSSRPI